MSLRISLKHCTNAYTHYRHRGKCVKWDLTMNLQHWEQQVKLEGAALSFIYLSYVICTNVVLAAVDQLTSITKIN